MEITPEIVIQVAKNARIKLKPEEIAKFTKDMQNVLSNFELLQELDVTGIEPSYHPIPVRNVLREDTVGECIDRKDALALTPHSTEEYFKGPKTK